MEEFYTAAPPQKMTERFATTGCVGVTVLVSASTITAVKVAMKKAIDNKKVPCVKGTI